MLLLLCCALFVLASSPHAEAVEGSDETGYVERLEPEVAAAKLAKRLEEGDTLPDFHLVSLRNKETVTKSTLSGKPAVLLFFGLDNEARKDRSFALLSILGKMQAVHGEAIRFFAICSDPEGEAAAQQWAQQAGLTFPILDDSHRSVYTLFGIFMMPEAMVISDDGRLDAKLPYSSDFETVISRKLKVVLGELTEEEAEREQQEHQVETSPELKKYHRHLNLAEVMTQRKMYAKAIEEYTAAAAMQPTDIKPLMEMGFVRIKMEDWSEAVAAFEKVLDMDPDAMDAVAGLGLALHGAGRDDEALPELLDASMVVRPMAAVFVAMAEIHTDKGEKDKALDMYRKAVKHLTSELEHHRAATLEPPQ